MIIKKFDEFIFESVKNNRKINVFLTNEIFKPGSGIINEIKETLKKMNKDLVIIPAFHYSGEPRFLSTKIINIAMSKFNEDVFILVDEFHRMSTHYKDRFLKEMSKYNKIELIDIGEEMVSLLKNINK